MNYRNELLEQQLNMNGTENKQGRPVTPDKQAGQKYNVELRKLVRAIRKDIDEQLLPLLRNLAPMYQADSVIARRDTPPMYQADNAIVTTQDNWFAQVTAAFDLIRSKYQSITLTSLYNEVARNFVRTSNTTSRTRYNRSMRSFGLDIYGDSPELNDYLEQSIYDNVRLIKSIPDQYLTQIESIVTTNIRAGNRPSAIEKLFRDQFGTTDKRAKMIARDQTAKVNGDLNRKRQTSSGFEYFQWVTSKDARVRDRHDDIANKVTAYGKGVYRWDNPPLSNKGVPIIPGSDYQCFPGTSQLDNTTFCNVVYRRWYTGELTELVFDDGVVLSSTANHPILTDKGFKPAHLIDNTDNIVRTLNESFITVELDRKGMKPTFEQVFSAFNLFGVKTSISTGVSSQFHGDGTDCDVDVIELNSLLMNVINPSIVKKFDEFGFTRSDQAIVFESLSCFGDGDFSSVTFRNTFNSLMSRFDLTTSLFLSHFTPLECFGLAMGSWFDRELLKVTPDDVSGNAKMFSDCVFAFAVLVHGDHLFTEFVERFLSDRFGGFNTKVIDRSINHIATNTGDSSNRGDGRSVTYKLDSIVDKRFVRFSGHVYNLQTISGDYTTGATVVSNCRCTARPVTNETVEANQKAGRTRPGVKR